MLKLKKLLDRIKGSNNLIYSLLGGLAFCILAFMTVALIAFFFYFDGNRRVKQERDEFNYVKEKLHVQKILSPSSRYIKVTAHYARIHSTHGLKYNRTKWIKKGKEWWKKQGMKKEIRTQWFRLCFEYSRILNIGYFWMISVSLIETGLNPVARTFWPLKEEETAEDLELLEAGAFQHRHIAVKDAMYYRSLMPEYLQNKFHFTFTKMEDLFDPINALKVQACLEWGAQQRFDHDPAWGRTAIHWGLSRIYKYWKAGVVPPMQFVFNLGTIYESARNPFTYFFLFEAYNSQFEKFTTKIFVEESWLMSYKKECSKIESDYLTTGRYVSQIINIAESMRASEIKHNRDYLAKDKKLEKKIHLVNDKYREISGLAKQGRIENYKDAFKQVIAEFMELARQVEDKEVEAARKVFLISLAVLGGIIVLLALGMIAVLGGLLYRKLRKRPLKGQNRAVKPGK